MLPFLLALVACGESGPDDPSPQEFVGTWEVSVAAETGCWPAFALRFAVEQEDADALPDDVDFMNMVSDWWNPGTPESTMPFSGNFNWGDDDFVFVFSHQGTTSLRMEGTGVDPEEVSGRFRDRDGQLFQAGCSADATARKL